jgi:hypothetical protein
MLQVWKIDCVGNSGHYSPADGGKAMSELREATIKVTLVHGGQLEFTIERNEEELRNTGSNIEKSMKANYIGVELDDKLTLIPAHNISSVEISPAPRVLIQHVITGARRTK